jgi:AcrR family transcriptional regulator
MRAATVEEIKSTALLLMRRDGSTDVRFTDIARDMGVTPPALYRYFPDRDALLTALVSDAWRDLAAELSNAVALSDGASLHQALGSICTAYRAWAHADPPRFALIFGLPLPHYAPPESARTYESARQARASLEVLLRAAITRGQTQTPAVDSIDDRLVDYLTAQGSHEEPQIPALAYQGLLHAWITIHGFVSLDVFGHLDGLSPQARDALFDSHVALAGLELGITPTTPSC